MNSPLIISFLVFLLCATIYCSNDWDDFDANTMYPYYNTSNCVFPFNYSNVLYYNCTTDGSNGDRPWCSTTPLYAGYFTKCYDFKRPAISCVFPFTLNGKNFTQCDYLSRTSIYKQCKTNDTVYKYLYCWELHTKPTGKPLVHFGDIDSRYKALSSTHTKGIGPDDHAVPIPVTASDQAAILDVHNTFRSAVNSTYMFKMYWDAELADMAQVHASMCGFDHDLSDNRFTLHYTWKNGQNMVMSTEIVTPISDLLTMMFSSEQPEFDYGVGCYDPGTCTHYTQLMMSNMTRVGCAQTHCLYPDRIERFVVCNYIHAQYSDNYMIPYVQSPTPASGCPAKADASGLCDCGNKICQYDVGEYLEPNTCKCIPPSGKRSIDEDGSNDEDVDEYELHHNQKPFVAIPPGAADIDGSKARGKRHPRENHIKNPVKRSLKVIDISEQTKAKINKQ